MLSELKAAEVTPQQAAATTAPVEAETAAPAGTESSGAGEGDSGQTEQQKLVPLAALHEERQARKEANARLRAIEDNQRQQLQIQQQRDQEWQVAQQRMQQIIAAQNRPAAPDPQQDPIAYAAHMSQQTAQAVENMQRQQAQRDQWLAQQQHAFVQQQNQERAGQQFVHAVTSSEAQFAQAHPDYTDAVKYAMDRRGKELTAAGWDPQSAAQMAAQDARNLAAQWVSKGQNPAERAYAMAQAMGYQPQASQADKQDMQEQGRAASKPTGGGQVRGRPSIAQVAAMTPQQLASLSDDDFRAAMGG